MLKPNEALPFNSQFEDFTDRVDLIRETGLNSVGYVVTGVEHHDTVVKGLIGRLTEHELEVISSPNPIEVLSSVTSLLNKGRAGRTEACGSTILDLAGIDYDDHANNSGLSEIFNSLNMGRNLLTNSAQLTVIVAPEKHFDLYKQQPDLYGTRAFVIRFTEK